MRYRPFGNTGINISELVMGGGNVGGILIHPGDDTKIEAVRRALAAGINWIDTAPSYGQGRSETALGWILKEVAETPHLSTKVRLDGERLDDIPGQIEESLHASLRRLDRQSVDLLQLHNHVAPITGGRAVSLEHVLGKRGAADGLERLRAQGLVRFIGFTALGDAGCCARVVESGLFDSAQVYFNLLNPSAARPMPPAWTGQDFGGLINICRENGVAILAIRTFAAGIIATDERTGREGILTKDTTLETEERKAAAVFATLGDSYGDRAQTALRFVLSQPDVAGAIVGMATLDHLRLAIAAAAMGPLPDPAMETLEALYDQDFTMVVRPGDPC